MFKRPLFEINYRNKGTKAQIGSGARARRAGAESSRAGPGRAVPPRGWYCEQPTVGMLISLQRSQEPLGRDARIMSRR